MTASVTHEASCSVPNAGSREVRTRTTSASSGGGFCAICAGSSGATMTLTGGPPRRESGTSPSSQALEVRPRTEARIRLSAASTTTTPCPSEANASANAPTASAAGSAVPTVTTARVDPGADSRWPRSRRSIIRRAGLGVSQLSGQPLPAHHAWTAVAPEAQLDRGAQRLCHCRAVERALRKERAEDHGNEANGETDDESRKGIFQHHFLRRRRDEAAGSRTWLTSLADCSFRRAC